MKQTVAQRWKCVVRFGLLTLLLLPSVPGLVSGEESTTRPKIGLVLGGGGARGAAHIGVLRVLEEQRIPIDYISGTSMGAIVGGGYASGYSPDEIESILTAIDWENLFEDDAPREELSFRRKLDDRRFAGVEFGMREGKLSMPRGAFAGRKLLFLLQKVFLDTSNKENFDQLGVPFRAVATDIETGAPVVLRDGSLALAIRASMSIPGAFAPVELKGYLVDGYVANNVPVNVVRTLGADRIIAIDVGTPLAKREELDSLLSMVNQVGAIATVQNVEQQIHSLGTKDILIRPDLGTYSVTDFPSISKIAPLGEQAARASIEDLKRFSVSEAEYQEFLKRQRRQPSTPMMIDQVVIAPTERVSTERIEAKMTVEGGKPLDVEELDRNLTAVQSIGEFEQVTFNLSKQNNQTDLVIVAHEKSWGPNIFRFGFNLASNFDADNYFNFLVDHRLTGINALGAEWQNQFQFGRTTRFGTEFYQPLDYSDRFFIAPHIEARQDLRDIYNDGDRVAEYRTRKYVGGADLGINFGTAAQLRAGIWSGYLEADTSTGASDLPEVETGRGGARFRFTYDQVDDSNFPREGTFFQITEALEQKAFGAEESFERTDLVLMRPVSFGRHTLLPKFLLGLNFDDDLPVYDQFVLGGLSTLSGFQTDELRGNQVGLAKLAYYYQLHKSLFSFARSSYLGGSVDLGNTWQRNDDIKLDDTVFGGSVFYGADTILGPLYFGFGLNEEARDGQLYFTLGQRL